MASQPLLPPPSTNPTPTPTLLGHVISSSRLLPLMHVIEQTLAPGKVQPPPSVTTGPVHNLMDTLSAVDRSNTTTLTSHRHRRPLILNPKLRYDFLSRRFRAFCEADPNSAVKDDDHYWNGATAWERSLAACCVTTLDTTQQQSASSDEAVEDNYGDDDSNVPGALARPKILRFVGVMAVHCQDLAAKALALAILERTYEADEDDTKEWVMETNRLERLAQRGTNETVVREDGSPTKRRRLTLSNADSEFESETSSEDWNDSAEATSFSETSHINNDDVAKAVGDAAPAAVVELHSMSPSVVLPRRIQPPSRLDLFLKAGGLPILSRWLMESFVAKSSTNTGVPGSTLSKALPASSAIDALTASSPTGALLLPLLLFLQKMPFDLKAIKRSKINKKITSLSKTLDSLMSSSQLLANTSPSTPRTGSTTGSRANPSTASSGLALSKIKSAVEQLKKVWGERAKETKEADTNDIDPGRSILEDPFAGLMASLEDRLDTLNKYEDAAEGSGEGVANMPAWLTEIVQQRQKSEAKRSAGGKHPTSQTMAEKARRERENERISKTKEDLEKTIRERRELLRKIRVLQQQQSTNEAETSARIRRSNATTELKRVQWKDNLGSMATCRQRDVLEHVHIFNKNDPASGFLEEEIVSIESIEEVSLPVL